jgi:bifunctional non-homologous end joining protein LigD
MSMAGRVLFPASGFTTEDLVNAYEQLAPVLLPHLAQRPLTLKRFPDDIHGEIFWEKDAPSFTPPYVERFRVPRKHGEGVINYMSLADVKSLRWAASVGCIEIHAFLHRYPFISSPTVITFDLDPGEGMNVTNSCAVALEIQEWFERYGLRSFAKLSGSKGLQVYVPLNTPSSYAITQRLSRRVAEELERRHPSSIISRMARVERAGKVFIDWSQNAEHKTTVSVYSIRAKHEQPYVSVPVTWTEVERAVFNRKAESLMFTPGDAIARVREVGDLFAPVLKLEQWLPESLYAELGVIPVSAVTPVVIPKAVDNPHRLPRSSGQGGRKLFVLHRLDSKSELGLEVRDEFRLFRFDKIPTGKSATAFGAEVGSRGLDYLTRESVESGIVWDLGTYEIVEGSFHKGAVDLYLSGRRLDGEWRLTKEDRHWSLKNAGGRKLRAIPAHGSALPERPAAQQSATRRSKRAS